MEPSGDHAGSDGSDATLTPEATITGLPPSASTTVRSQVAPARALDQYAKRRPSGEYAIPPICERTTDQAASPGSVGLDDDDVAAAREGKEAVGRGPRGEAGLAVCR